MPRSFASLHVHLVFSTKDRAPLIAPERAERLHAYLGGIARAADCPALVVGGMPDHVHMLVGLSRERTVSNLVRDLKANSSRWAREEFAHKSFAWQTGYGAFAVSQSNVAKVRRYVENQAEHHRRFSFQEEFRTLLERHGIAFDERYLWG
jgi:REP element-mobilizing transposase RayT